MLYSKRFRLLVGCVVLGTASSVAAKSDFEDQLDRMMLGQSAMQGKELESAIEQAEAFPLGSDKNPVRVTMPPGQRAYLAKLRCSDGQAPEFYRQGTVGPGPYRNIVDLYIVECRGGSPARSEIHMDMYHGGYAESRPVPGFTTAGGPTTS